MSRRRLVARGLARLALRTVLLVVVPVVAILVGVYIYAESGRYVTTENAYIKSNVVAISSDVSGRVEWVGVDDNSLVRKGQILFRLDQQPFRIALERCEAELELVRTQVEQLRTDYHEAVAQVAAEVERVKFLTRQLARQETLKKRKLASEQAYDVAAHDLSLAKRQVRVLRQRVQGVLHSLGGNPDIDAEEHPRFLRARTERDQASIALADTSIEAPVDGVVSNMKLQAGEYVEEGHAVFSIIETGKVWVEANLKETQLTHVPGRTVGVDCRRRLSGRRVAGNGRCHRTGHRSGVLGASAAECDRQLGEGGSAHTGAARRRAAAERSCVASGDDGDGRHRHRARARDAGVIARLVRR